MKLYIIVGISVTSYLEYVNFYIFSLLEHRQNCYGFFAEEEVVQNCQVLYYKDTPI